MMKYLKNIQTLEALKKEYHQWAMKLHPDLGGSDEEMKVLNAEYELLFEKVRNTHINKNGEEYHKETNETSDNFRHIIDELLKMNGIKIETIGCFIWVNCNTKPYKENLKDLGMKWHRKKACWFLSPEGYRRFGNKEYSMNDIRKKYGVNYSKEVIYKEIAE